MENGIAIFSIFASTLVVVFTTLVNARIGRDQRAHERAMAADSQVSAIARDRATTFLQLSTWFVALDETNGYATSELVRRPRELDVNVLAYGGAELYGRLKSFDFAAEELSWSYGAYQSELRQRREAKEEAINHSDWEKAASERDEKRAFIARRRPEMEKNREALMREIGKLRPYVSGPASELRPESDS